MKARIQILAIGLLAIAAAAGAQQSSTGRIPRINTYHGDPTGVACSDNAMVQSDTTGGVYGCSGGQYKIPGGYAGVSSDGASGLSVTGQIHSGGLVTTGKVVAPTSATIDVQSPAYGMKCDGTSDDTTNMQAAVNAAETAGAALIFPANATCKITAAVTISGIVQWQGTSTTIAMSPVAVTQQMFAGSAISKLDISGFTFQGNSNTVAAFNIAGGTNQNINFHGNTFTGFTGCPANPNTWLNASIILSAANDVKIKDNNFVAGGCQTYWSTGGPTGAAVWNYTTPSYRWEISGNKVDNTYADFGFMLFNLYEYSFHDNEIKNVVLGAGSDANSSGYAFADYATAICGGTTLASPSGLSRTSNVVTFNFSGTCSPALAVGDHINIYGSTSVGGTGFDGGYTITAGGTTSATGVIDSGVSLADDTGGAGNSQYAPRLGRIHDNAFVNIAGSGVYLQGDTDSSVSNNGFNKICQTMDDSALPCGYVALNGAQRISVNGNTGAGSVKDGIVSVNGVNISVNGNDVAGVRYGLRLRGTDTKETWFGNNVNGASYGELIDGAAQLNVSLANTFMNVSGAHIGVSNSSAFYNTIVASEMDGGLFTGVSGIQNTLGANNIFALNMAYHFRGSAFDIRTANDLAAFNYIAGGTGNGFSTGSGSYGLYTKNYLFQPNVGFSDTGGQSNVISDNYIAGATTPLGTINGLAIGNQLKGGTSGVFALGTCTLVAGTCTISTAEVQSTDNGRIWCTRGATGANPGFPYVSTITAGTSFVVTSTNAADTGNVACEIRH